MTTQDELALQQWLDKLDQHPLPVLPTSLRRVRELLNDANVPLKEVGRVIASDPAMCLHVMRVAVKQHSSRLGGAPGNIHQCIALLGLTRLRPLLGKLRPMSDDISSPAQQGYVRALGHSLHATAQIGGWLRYRSQPGADQLLQAALLYGAAQWALWHVAPDDMQIVERLVAAERIPQEEAEMAVLGCTREQIARGLGQRWHFPREVVENLDKLQMPSPAYLLRCSRLAAANPNYRLASRDPAGHIIRSPGMTLRLGYWLAQEAERDWYSVNTRRCLAIIAVYLTVPMTDLRKITTEGALFVSHYWRLPGMAAPACNLLWPVLPRRPRRIKPRQVSAAVTKLRTLQAAAAPVPPPAPAPRSSAKTGPKPIGIANDHLPQEFDRNRIRNAPLPPVPAVAAPRFAGFRSEAKKQEFQQFLLRLQHEPDYFKTEYEVVRAVVEALHDCTGLERVLVALCQRNTDQVESYFALGCEQSPAMKRFKVNLQPVNLFTHIVKQPAGVWISPERPNPMNTLVPGSLKQATQCDEFFLMSVFNHRGPCAVFYADRGTSARINLSEHEYTPFKAACSACSKHLIARGKRAAARRTPE